MTSIPCDIVLLPEPTLAQNAIAASSKLVSLNSPFALENINFHAHISLYMTQLKLSSLDDVKNKLATIAASTTLYDLIATNYDQTKGFLDVEYKRTDALTEFQSLVISAINPLRDGMREKEYARMAEATGLAR